MKKFITLFLILISGLLLSGCTEPKEDDTPCGDTMVLVEGICTPKESFCTDTQAYIDGTCKEITCATDEVIINRTCQVAPETCNVYETLTDGECVDTYSCNVDSTTDECILIETTDTCVTGGNIMIDGKCFGANQTCSVTQELRDNVCIDLTACEIDENSTTCATELEAKACSDAGNTYVDGVCEVDELVCDTGYSEVNGECVIDVALDNSFLDIYYLNDFHGAIINDGSELGLARIANYILTKKEENPDNTLFVTGGDILQGSALSNYFIGESTIDLLDLSQLDAFVLGNHEFDWGLDEITKYFDEIEENGEADYPLLGANVFLKGTTDLPDFVDPYTIVQKGDLKIGIIGVIGYGLESSIATSKVADYEFAYAVPIIEEYATYLRGTEGCDVILVVAHDSGGINNAVSALTGLAKVDAIFNGHSHQAYVEGTNAPVIQSGSNGKYVGHVRLEFNEAGTVSSYFAENLDQYDDVLFQTPHPLVQALIDTYILETTDIFDTPIITPDEYLSSGDLSHWIAQVIMEATGSDIAFQNHGGTRRSISDGEVITLSVLYEVWPFDNAIKTVMLPGSVVKDLLNDGNAYYTTISNFDDNTMYKVATNDYLFDKVTNPFLDGTDITLTGLLLRDLAVDEMTLQSYIYSYFLLSNDIQTAYYGN